ncbi:MBL fold metallo-hydrolase [Candidatus Parcubacteria bacterium]|nr:MBL fold metallo-hydrolase [Candidatus Parcubacteria bacterium]
MVITWYGQSCFRIQSSETVLVIDPFSKEIGLVPPRGRADAVLVSHHHFDHNNVSSLEGEPAVLDGPGEYEVKEVAVRGILADHDEVGGAERGKVTIFTLELEDIRLCHLSDLGQKRLTETQVEAIGEVDILLVPVGGVYTIGGREAALVVNQIEPRIVIPMHYLLPGLTINLEPADAFFKEMGIAVEAMPKLTLKKKDLPTGETKIVQLTFEK